MFVDVPLLSPPLPIFSQPAVAAFTDCFLFTRCASRGTVHAGLLPFLLALLWPGSATVSAPFLFFRELALPLGVDVLQRDHHAVLLAQQRSDQAGRHRMML